LSALTKILIVLLSLFSLFLCGTVVTYVSTAKNYKNAYLEKDTELAAVQKKNQSYQQQLEEKKRQMDELSNKLDTEMTKLKAEKAQLEQNLKDAERAKTDLDERAKTLAAAALKFQGTVEGMEGSLKETREELDKARAEGVKLAKNLNEITGSLEEKMAQLNALEAEKKRLLEEKTKLEQQLTGKTTKSVISGPVTVVPDSATKAIEPPTAAVLQGKVAAVDGSLVTLSIGSADGVEKGMIFHVIRNDSFMCDIKITDVDTEASAGTTQLVQQQPKVGDIASTTW